MTISTPGHIALEAVIIVSSFFILCLRIYLNLRTPGGRVKALVISDWLLISAQAIGTIFLGYQIWKNVMLMRSNNPFQMMVSEGQLKVGVYTEGHSSHWCEHRNSADITLWC